MNKNKLLFVLWLILVALWGGVQQSAFADKLDVVAPDKTVWVAKPGSNLIEHQNLDGNLIAQIDTPSNGGGSFYFPSLILPTADGGDVWLWVDDGKGFRPFDPVYADANLPLPAIYDDQQEKLYLQDVLTNDGEHYQAVLQRQNGQFKLLSSNKASKLFTDFSSFGIPPFGSNDYTELNIPLVKAFGKYYRAKLKHVGNYAFELQSAEILTGF